MRAFRPAGFAACGVLAGLLGAAAQEPAISSVPAIGTAPAIDAVPAPEPVPPPIDARRNNAAKLAGLAGFVNLACPNLRSDPARLKQAVEAMGVDVPSLETGDLQLAAHAYIEAYHRDVAESCRRAEERFGPSGSLIPGLILPR